MSILGYCRYITWIHDGVYRRGPALLADIKRLITITQLLLLGYYTLRKTEQLHLLLCSVLISHEML